MHLLTREALALLVFTQVGARRPLLFHISSRTLDLRPVVGALAADAGLAVWMLYDRPPPG